MTALLTGLVLAWFAGGRAQASPNQALASDPEVAWFDSASMHWEAGRLSELQSGSEFLLDGQHYVASGGGAVAWLGQAPEPWEFLQADYTGAELWELEQAPAPRPQDWVYALVAGRHLPLQEADAGELVSYAGKLWLFDGERVNDTGMAMFEVEATHVRPAVPTMELAVGGAAGVGRFVGSDHPFYLAELGVYRDIGRLSPGQSVWALGDSTDVVRVDWTGVSHELYNISVAGVGENYIVWGDPGFGLSHNCRKKGSGPERTEGGYWVEADPGTLKPVMKKKRPKIDGKAAASDAPGWAKEHRPYLGESGKDFATRLLNEKYGAGNWTTGAGTEYSQIKKWGDRAFVDPE